jgi:O-antigen/teichoic acid export membrane protein
MNLLKKSLKDTVYYSLATAGSKVGSFLLIPLINSVLSVEKFGEYDLFLISAAFITLIIGLGIDSGIAIIIAENKKKQKKIKFIFTYSLIISLGLLYCLAFIGFLANMYLKIFELNVYLLLILYVNFTYITYFVFNFIRWIDNTKIAALISFYSSILSIVIGVLFLYFINKSIESLFLGIVIGSLFGSIMSLLISKKYISFKIIKEGKLVLKDLLKLGIPFVPTYLVNYFSVFCDRFIILFLIGDIYLIGLYALFYRISQIGGLVVNLITKGFLPVMYNNYESSEGKILIRKVFNFYNLLLIPILILIYFFSNFLIKILGGKNYSEFLEYSYLLPSLFMSTMIASGMSTNGFGFTIKRKTKYIAIISFSGLALNFIISLIFVPLYGFSIIVTSTLISSILIASIYTIISERLFKFNYNIKTMLFIYFTLFIISQTLIFLN